MDFIRRCWAEISLDALRSNLELIRRKVGGADIMCVVKANAYGHGDEAVVRELECAGVRHFAVATPDEALRVRSFTDKSEILLLGAYDRVDFAVDSGISLSVCDYEAAVAASRFAQTHSKTSHLHVKLNTGMTRVGLDCVSESDISAAADVIEKIAALPSVELVGAFSHFAVSDEPDGKEFTTLQLERLISLRKAVESRGVNIKCWHFANSGAIAAYPCAVLDMVRAGIILYGLYNGIAADGGYEPVLSLKSVVTQVRDIPAGTPISYGCTFVSEKPMRVAVIGIGYADGYSRLLSNRGRVIINGKYADIVGRVCMDQTIVDISEIDCKAGDTVTVIGKQGNACVSADDIARLCGTINYETVCGISYRVPRVYFKNGTQTEIKRYI